MNKEFKQHFRTYLRKKRAGISQIRRDSASEMAYTYLRKESQSNSWILSYASFGTELDLWRLNRELAQAGKLVLPKMEQHILRLFKVKDLVQLETNQWGILEPNSSLCEELNFNQISLAFIPGLGFDSSTKHRLGYGRGYYDRLLSKFSKQTACWGVGFKEQEMIDLPFNEQDVPLSQHYLF